MRRIAPAVRQRSRELRRPQTPTEQVLWGILRSRQTGGLKFRRQQPIGQFIVDFYCPEARLVIEIDGDTHADQVEYDQARTDWIQSMGYRVIRFTNHDVRENVSAVLESILDHCKTNTCGD